MSIEIHPTVAMATKRCDDCGRWWAHELYRHAICPECAAAKKDWRVRELHRLERSNAALRGALKRAKSR